MSLTLYYVDPAAGSDSTGTGAIGAPWQTTQHALNTIVQGAGGDQINLKAGTDDVLSAALSLTTYGSPSNSKPLLLRGYTTAANDGGIGGLSGNASVAIWNDAAHGTIILKDLHLHNCGAATICTLSGSAANIIENCEIDTTTGTGVVMAAGANIMRCYLHDIGGTYMVDGGNVRFCRLECLGKTPTNCVRFQNTAADNTIACTAGVTAALVVNASGAIAHRNSIWSNAGTGIGIKVTIQATLIFDNIVEGFSGAGGKGISDGANNIVVYGKNQFYNNTSNTSLSGEQEISLGADVSNSASAYNNPSGAPADLSLNTSSAAFSNIKAASYPGAYYGSPFTSYRDSGAVQHQDSGGGTTTNIFSHPRKIVIQTPSRPTRLKAFVIPSPALPIPTPLRRRPYPVYLPARRNVSGAALFAAPIILRTPARQIVRQNYVRRNAGHALFSSITNNTVLVASPRKVR